MRARVSTALPAENGTMRCTGFAGQVCAAACATQSKRLRTTPMRIAIPDDYQDIVHRLKCFELLRGHEVVRFREPARDEDELAERLADAQAVVAIRERVAFPRSLLERLPKLELLALVGRHSKVIDFAACKDLGIDVVQGSKRVAGVARGADPRVDPRLAPQHLHRGRAHEARRLAARALPPPARRARWACSAWGRSERWSPGPAQALE